MRPFVAGTSRRLGLQVVVAARQQGHEVNAMFRSGSQRGAVEATGATAVLANAFEAEAVKWVVGDAGPIDAMLCTLGGKPGDNPRIDYVGGKHCVDAAHRAGITPLLLVKAIGCGDTYELLEPRAQAFLKDARAEKNRVETYLRVSGLDYTILRRDT
ncbi:MAG: hypothetical protein EXQ85_08460 [Alphaproteobacteria bacterium]|nr:hypothetical protein [Alphaproteobacteria bacterium]